MDMAYDMLKVSLSMSKKKKKRSEAWLVPCIQICGVVTTCMLSWFFLPVVCLSHVAVVATLVYSRITRYQTCSGYFVYGYYV